MKTSDAASKIKKYSEPEPVREYTNTWIAPSSADLLLYQYGEVLKGFALKLELQQLPKAMIDDVLTASAHLQGAFLGKEEKRALSDRFSKHARYLERYPGNRTLLENTGWRFTMASLSLRLHNSTLHDDRC